MQCNTNHPCYISSVILIDITLLIQEAFLNLYTRSQLTHTEFRQMFMLKSPKISTCESSQVFVITAWAWVLLWVLVACTHLVPLRYSRRV